MTTLKPYIAFQNTKEALKYYEDLFGATDIKRLPLNKEQASHFNVAAEKADEATMHAEFKILNTTLYAADAFGKEAAINGAISLMLEYNIDASEDADNIEALYERLKHHESIQIEMPFEPQFWGGKMGVIIDKYGIRWMLHGYSETK
ncbi:VOC family protein [Staphylococcus felis]|uniref:Glyoxalase/bleomycin resistance/extradiol dioxygenase family protein n=2 Tax=Staphylococcus felis TaxID=46127 RepID=A0A3E0ING6_9STAP|nr:glyoxalase/bleomycin resistance/extradiol dioxygenase family protein [Staphylococcus felis]MBH9581745.1 glyoxalase/bleomycin resistance/extradiol dioxygenase family protein [Staphylococcus felis]MDM8328470.1 glyoxalase/bleomycin resistance/extradiol dioxygenase family protein [Staphylococcus felis]MDQ7193889.1 glyoxalase/bleomycin resistance/extradiol dioxygenase family protein [Staphylococcus felis]REH76806.1 VOC family protein [Staphylococcus felis]REH77756.1 VOC family protein [Staphyloc